MKTKAVTGIVIDPYKETADIDTSNNIWPVKELPTRFQVFKKISMRMCRMVCSVWGEFGEELKSREQGAGWKVSARRTRSSRREKAGSMGQAGNFAHGEHGAHGGKKQGAGNYPSANVL